MLTSSFLFIPIKCVLNITELTNYKIDQKKISKMNPNIFFL